MTCFALPIGFGGAAGAAITERGLSEDATKIRNLILDAVDFANSVSVGEIRRESEHALDAAYQGAQAIGWDGYGALPVEYSAYEYAKAFLRMLPTGTRPPEVAVDSDGDIAFEWDFGRRCVFSVSVGRDGTLTYAGLFGWSKTHGVEQLGEGIPEAISLCIERVQREASSVDS